MSYELTSEMYIDQSKDWYYVQGFKQNFGGQVLVIVFAKTKKEALEKLTDWKKQNNIDDIHLYRNNYKPDARHLVRTGKVIK